MKAILHIGMHKTGTSSMQASFAQQAPVGVSYFAPGGDNLNAWVRTLFDGDAALEDLSKLRGIPVDDIKQNRAPQLAQTNAFVADCTEPSILFSAERLTYSSPGAVARLRDWLAQHFETVEVYAYIRDPLAFVRSSYQQRIKSLAPDETFDRDLPIYRKRFEKFEEVFGTVNYRLYRSGQLKDRDVVLDFTDWIGAEYDPAHSLRVNESLSLEALAYLVAYRRGYRRQKDGPRPSRLMKPLLAQLLEHKGRRWSLAPKTQNKIIKDISEDCDWMDARLPEPLKREDDPADITIAEANDFIPVALETFPEMRDLLIAGLLGENAAPKDFKSSIALLKKLPAA